MKIEITRETVCPLGASTVEDNLTLSVKSTMPPEMKDQVNAFKEEVKTFTGGVEGVTV